MFIFQINGIPVERITRRGAEAVNFVTEEIPADTEVDKGTELCLFSDQWYPC